MNTYYLYPINICVKEHQMKRLTNSYFFINQFKLVSYLALCLLTAVGCSAAITKKSPPISHIHVGHALTGWVATPGKKGLLTTAELESKIVLDNALKAANSKTLSQKKLYMSNALHAVDPKTQSQGPGKGYGLTRSISESIAHIQYAADSDDASVNIKRTVPTIVKNAQKIASSSNQLKVFGQAALNSSTMSEMNALTNEFLTTAKNINNGGTTLGTYSLKQFKQDIQAMVNKEQPAYTTVDSYYLFNLIRLPNGKWGFSSKANDKSSDGIY